MKKKLVFLLALALIVVMAFGACAPQAAQPSASTASNAEESNQAPSVEPSASESTAPAASAFIAGKPQIQAPVQGQLDVIDVIAKIDEETKANNYKQYNWTFGLHSYDPGYEGSAAIASGIREEAAKYGIKIVESYCNMDVAKYPANYQTFITQKVDLILDAGWLGNKSVVDTAMEAGIPIVSYDVPFDSTRMWTIGGDPSVAGTTIGKYMGGKVKEKWDGKVDAICISWSQALGEPMRVRMQSAIDAMKAEGLEIPDNIVNWYNSDGETLKAKNIAADFLTAHPNDHHILMAANNGQSGQGMLAAVQAAGREDDVMIYSYGAEQVAIDNFNGKENCWVGDVGYYFKQYGWLGVNTAIRVMNGEKVGYWTTPQNFVIDYKTIKDYKGV